MLIALLLLSITYSTKTLNALPVKATGQPTTAGQDIQETDFPLSTMALRLYLMY
jgi:hypothetical protein